MAAFINALREEGTKEDCLAAVERLWDKLAAARLAGKLEGMEIAATLCEDRAIRHGWNYHLPSVGRELAHALRAKIAELEATTTPASPGSSDEKPTAE